MNEDEMCLVWQKSVIISNSLHSSTDHNKLSYVCNIVLA